MELEEANERRSILLSELSELKLKAQSFGISGNRKYYARGTISKEVFDAYKENSSKILSIEKEIIRLNTVIKTTNNSQFNEKQLLINLLKEILTPKDFKNVFNEFLNRAKGCNEFKVVLSENDNSIYIQKIKCLEKTIDDCIDKLITARKGITNYISQNEPEINKANYLISVSSLNKCCPPLKEIINLKK